jgi:hypothetical protein
MAIIQSVRCPNCGKFAERLYLPLIAQVQTQCAACDYLLISCTRTGKVLEAYYPGINFQHSLEHFPSNNRISKFIKVPTSHVLSTASV